MLAGDKNFSNKKDDNYRANKWGHINDIIKD